MSAKTKALLAICIVSFLWATAGAAKPLVRLLDPYTVAFLRFLIASLVVVPLYIVTKNKHSPSLFGLVPIALMTTANVTLYYVGLETSTANAAAIIYMATPIAIAILSHWVTNETFSARKIAGIALGVCGGLFIALLPLLEKGQMVSGSLPGNLFFILAIGTWAVYSVGSKRAIQKKGYTPVALTTVSIVSTAVILGIVSLFTWKSSYGAIVLLPGNLFLLFYLAIAVSVVTFLLYQWVLRNSSATIASLYIYLQVIFAVIFNHIFLGEPITPWFLVGGVITIFGVLLASGK